MHHPHVHRGAAAQHPSRGGDESSPCCCPACRWQKNKDVYWYTREKEDGADQSRENELRAVKQREEELMLEVTARDPLAH